MNTLSSLLKFLGELHTVKTPTISISSSTGTLLSYKVRRYGNVVMLQITVQKSTETASGDNLYEGTISTTALRPLMNAHSTAYYGAHAMVGRITDTGSIVVRNASSSSQAAITGSSSVVLGFTYLVA